MDDSVNAEDLGAFFTGLPQHVNFCRMSQLVPTREMRPSLTPFEWPKGPAIDLLETYTFRGQTRSTARFLDETDTAALLVLKHGAICLEQYALTGGVEVPWLSMSVAKSFISALIGIAIAEGFIGSVDEPISDHVPVNPGTAYDGVSIKDVLQMSFGARWNEDYSDKSSEIFQLSAAMSGVGTLDEFIANMVREREPGKVCRYNSGDTQALGSLLVHATKRSISDYMQEKLCEPLGMVSPGYWLIDSAGMEMAFAGLNLTARDFAKLGELFRNGGAWNGRQIVPRDWVTASTRADAPHLLPGQPIVGSHSFDMGYGYQWWLPAGAVGEFSAIGVYNQLVYVNPEQSVVIVKLSANRLYGTAEDEAINRDHENIVFLQSIANAV